MLAGKQEHFAATCCLHILDKKQKAPASWEMLLVPTKLHWKQNFTFPLSSFFIRLYANLILRTLITVMYNKVRNQPHGLKTLARKGTPLIFSG
jgi:hypothetical protein